MCLCVCESRNLTIVHSGIKMFKHLNAPSQAARAVALN